MKKQNSQIGPVLDKILLNKHCSGKVQGAFGGGLTYCYRLLLEKISCFAAYTI